MVVSLSKIKDYGLEKLAEDHKVYITTLYKNGVMYIPRAMGGVFADYSLDYSVRSLVLCKVKNYKKHIYIPTVIKNCICGRENCIKIRFEDMGKYYKIVLDGEDK